MRRQRAPVAGRRIFAIGRKSSSRPGYGDPGIRRRGRVAGGRRGPRQMVSGIVSWVSAAKTRSRSSSRRNRSWCRIRPRTNVDPPPSPRVGDGWTSSREEFQDVGDPVHEQARHPRRLRPIGFDHQDARGPSPSPVRAEPERRRAGSRPGRRALAGYRAPGQRPCEAPGTRRQRGDVEHLADPGHFQRVALAVELEDDEGIGPLVVGRGPVLGAASSHRASGSRGDWVGSEPLEIGVIVQVDDDPARGLGVLVAAEVRGRGRASRPVGVCRSAELRVVAGPCRRGWPRCRAVLRERRDAGPSCRGMCAGVRRSPKRKKPTRFSRVVACDARAARSRRARGST